MSKEMLWVMYAALIVAGGGIGWYIGKKYNNKNVGVAVGVAAGMAAAGGLYYSMMRGVESRQLVI